MKKLISFFSVALIIASCSNDAPTNSADKLTIAQTENTPKEELPPLKTSSSNVGRLKMHDNGYSIGKKTELTELRKLLKNKDCDIIEIVWVWDCSPRLIFRSCLIDRE